MPTIKTSNFSQDAAEYIAKQIRETVKASETCVLCLSGGRTPISVYETLATTQNIPWNRVYVTFGDERNVPKEDAESNYKNAYDLLLSRIKIPEENIIRIKTELGFTEAAATYEEDLNCLRKNLNKEYIFDIMLLGLGGDGHTASLFPGSPALSVTDRNVFANTVNHIHPERITLTYPAISRAKQIIFLVNDPSKKEVIEKIQGGANFPATKIAQLGDSVTWIIGE